MTTNELNQLKQSLEDFLKRHLGNGDDPRQEIRLAMIDDATLAGEIISSAFSGKTSSEQQEYFENLLKLFSKETGRKKGFTPAVLLYTPDEHRKLGIDESPEIQGVLKSVDLNTAAANDLYVTVKSNEWFDITKRIDLSEAEDSRYHITCLVTESENLHLIKHLEYLFSNDTYKWFSCDGYYFREIRNLRVDKQINTDQVISFSAESVPPWEV